MNYLDIHFLFLGIMYTFIVDARNHGPHPDSIVLSCGSSSNEHDDNGRIWVPDSEFLKSSENSVVSTADFQDSSLPSRIPYMTARFFTQESSYAFSISPNSRHWIRLHFYPSSYSDFNSSDGYFSVTANQFRLLNNFSAAITAQALTQSYIFKEFSLQPEPSGRLNLTFRPSNSHDSAYAFVNGIEIISTPELFNSAPLVGFSGHSIEFEFNSLQTMVRLNVGGQFITARNDSGLTRTWYDDTPYVYGGALGVSSQAAGVAIRYPPGFPEFIAPDSVYKTARSMGKDVSVNANYNLTWMFQVDANFTYLVRLHFCEYQMSKVNQRVFGIFLNNETAFPDADVFAWSHAQGVPVFRDFAVLMKNETDLVVTLRPNMSTKPEFYDVVLNGLEVFKVNDTQGNLAGPNPAPSKFSPETDHVKKKPIALKNSLIVIILSAIFGGFFGFAIAVGLIAFILQRRKRRADAGTGGAPSSVATSWLPVYTNSRTTDTGNVPQLSSKISNPMMSKIGGNLCRHFSLSEILQGTNNFNDSLVIGVGGFGKVYKGFIDGETEVAIKRANPSSEQGFHEFQTEIALLSKLRHRHLVSLIGACEEGNEMILVYDYMANGTLREHLYKNNNKMNPVLTWKTRLDICIGAARGLHYLHTGAKHTIIHRDVKSTNILLDEKWVAKVSDFGLSKTRMTVDQAHISTRVKGSFGYLDPEYFRRQQLTEKSDVYSFGVVLFEALCGRPALNPNLPREQVSLADWALECHSKGTLLNQVDPFIRDEITMESLDHFAETGTKCLSDEGSLRPSMGAVLWNLEYTKQLQNNPDTPVLVAERGANDAFAMHETLLSVEEEKKMVEEGEGDEGSSSSNIVFSQIINQQGR